MTKKMFVTLLGLFVMGSVSAQEESFFTDPSVLEPWEKGTFDYGWVRPDVKDWAVKYDSVMIDQPEVFVAADSKYRGAKPDHLKLLSDTARAAVAESMEAGGFAVVEGPGPNVVYIRWALDDLYLKKKKRGFLSYTPIGAVAHGVRQATIEDLWEKIDINEMGLKIEWLDSTTGELISAGSASQGLRKAKGQKADLVTSEELHALFRTIGEQTRCHMENNKIPATEHEDCDAIIVEPVVEPEPD